MAPDQREAEALMYNRQYIDIYSNSWGPSSKGFEVKGPGYRTQRALRDGATEVKFFRCFIADVFTKVIVALDFSKASFTHFQSQQSLILIFLFSRFSKTIPVFTSIVPGYFYHNYYHYFFSLKRSVFGLNKTAF